MASPIITLGFFALLVMLFFISQDKKFSTPRFEHSYFKSTHHELNFYNLNMTIDFNESKWYGNIDLSLKSKIKVLSTINLDMHSQKIKQVLLLNWPNKEENNTSLAFLIVESEATKAGLGQILTINMPSDFCGSQCEDAAFVIRVIFETNSTVNGEGNNFFSPQQTFDATYYFYYSYFYPIFCRQFVPIHDSMLLKATYNATIYVPKGYMVWMSAENIGNENLILNNEEFTVFYFSQSIPISSYLLNLVVGVLIEKKISKKYNISILVEKSRANQTAALNTEEIEKYWKVMEELLFPMPLNKTPLNVLIMPKFFPNYWLFSPYLIFLSNTNLNIEKLFFMIICSYFSVYVQVPDWSFLYLMDGYTEFLIYKILNRLDEEDATARLNLTINSFEYYMNFYKNQPKSIYLTEMEPNLFGISPVEFSIYTQSQFKGLIFFLHIEKILGNDFLNFTANFLKNHEFKIVDTQIFQNDLLDFLNTNNTYRFNGLEQRKQIDWRRWLTVRGDIPWLPQNLTSVSLEKGIWFAKKFIYEGIFDINEFKNMNRRGKV